MTTTELFMVLLVLLLLSVVIGLPLRNKKHGRRK